MKIQNAFDNDENQLEVNVVPIFLDTMTDLRKRSLSQRLLLAFSNQVDDAGELKCLFSKGFLGARDRAQLHVQEAYRQVSHRDLLASPYQNP